MGTTRHGSGEKSEEESYEDSGEKCDEFDALETCFNSPITSLLLESRIEIQRRHRWKTLYRCQARNQTNRKPSASLMTRAEVGIGDWLPKDRGLQGELMHKFQSNIYHDIIKKNVSFITFSRHIRFEISSSSWYCQCFCRLFISILDALQDNLN